MKPSIVGQIYAGIIISSMILAVPAIGVWYGWRKWPSEIYNGKLPIWRRITATAGIIVVTAQTILFFALLITIFRYRVLVPYRVFLFGSVFAELVLLFVAAPCTFAWTSGVRWWLFASSLYLPVISFFSVLAVLAY